MLLLNFFEVLTSKESIALYSTDYEGNWEKLRKLRSNYQHFEFYLYHGKNINKSKIFCWVREEVAGTSIPDEFTPDRINSKDHPTIWIKVIESAFVELFRKNKRDIYKPKYSYIWHLKLDEKKNKIFSSVGLKSVPLLDFSFHFLKPPSSSNLIFGISVRKSFKNEFTLSEDDFLKQGIDTRNWTRNSNGEIITSITNIKKLLEATGCYSKYRVFKEDEYSLEKEYCDIEYFYQKFVLIKDRVFLPDGLKIDNIFLNKIPNSNFQNSIIQKPTYYFYNESTGGGYYNDRLKKLKPTSFDNFRNKEVKLLVITPLEYEGSTGSFSTKLINTFREVFHLNVSRDTKTFDHNQPYAYSNLLKNLDVSDYDIVLHVVSSNDKKRAIKASPYFVFKAKILNQKVPTQKILIETIRRSNQQILNAIALNIYSKIGGTAWTIEKDIKDKIEIIIGIGSTVDFKKNRIMGFANVLDYNGNYITGDCTQITDIPSYRADLQKHLVNTINGLIAANDIHKNNKFRLIFHLTKEAGKKNEIKAIENAIKHFKGYQIQFGIFHLSYGHNFRIFNASKKEIHDKNETLLVEPPYRGTFIQISEKLALLHLGKPSKVPILVRMDSRSTYRDLYSATKQVLFFTHLSHKSFRPSSKPVTISYPSQMAKLLSELNQVPDWDKQMINHLKETLWFI